MKTEKILECLRSRIVSGEFPPGTKLPNRPELLREYSVSVGAFQKCINQLIDWGFLESRGMHGMCVPANPPHLSRFAILLPLSTTVPAPGADPFLAGFVRIADEYKRRHPEHTFVYYGVGDRTEPHMEEYERIAEDVRRGLLAGIISIFSVPPPPVQRQLEDFPLVVIARKRESTPHPYPQIEFDLVELFRCQLRRLEEAGCRNIAALLYDNISMPKCLAIFDLAAQSRANCPRAWLAGMNPAYTRSVFYDNLLELIFSKNQAVIPDGLIVSSENFLPLVFNAFTRLRIVPGRDVKIVSHRNTTSAVSRVPGIEYVTFSVEQVFQEALRQLRDWNTHAPSERAVDIRIPPQDTMHEQWRAKEEIPLFKHLS